jgi:hypothetical protein
LWHIHVLLGHYHLAINHTMAVARQSLYQLCLQQWKSRRIVLSGSWCWESRFIGQTFTSVQFVKRPTFWTADTDSVQSENVAVELVSWELLWLRHGDSSITQRKENICRQKMLPEDWWTHSWLRRLSIVVNCRVCGIATALELTEVTCCKRSINSVTIRNPIMWQLCVRGGLIVGDCIGQSP